MPCPCQAASLDLETFINDLEHFFLIDKNLDLASLGLDIMAMPVIKFQN